MEESGKGHALRCHNSPKSPCAPEKLYLGVTTAGPGRGGESFQGGSVWGRKGPQGSGECFQQLLWEVGKTQ